MHVEGLELCQELKSALERLNLGCPPPPLRLAPTHLPTVAPLPAPAPSDAPAQSSAPRYPASLPSAALP
jgi:hypothetical protein